MKFVIDPMGKPRITWQGRFSKPAKRYYEYANVLKLVAKVAKFSIPESVTILFYLPMPASWSKKKKVAMLNHPHQQKPDIDNVTKGVFDALCKDDSFIHEVLAKKFWSDRGRIEIYDRDPTGKFCISLDN